jgi:hypothetical protein
MKYLLAVVAFVCYIGKSWGQMKIDTTISKAFGDTTFTIKDTLSVLGKKRPIPNDKIEISLRRNGKPIYYRLYIHFKTNGVFSISDKYSADFKAVDGSVISLAYDGDYKLYSSADLASFSIEITDHLDEFKETAFSEIHLGMSDGGYTIILEDRFQKKIAEMIKGLLDLNK